MNREDVIENRHTGIPTMIREMKKMNLPEPEFIEERVSFKVIFRNSIVEHNIQNSDTQNILEVDLLERLLIFCKEPKTSKQIRDFLNISSKRYVAYKIIKPLINSGKLDYTNKRIINARNQKYISK